MSGPATDTEGTVGGGPLAAAGATGLGPAQWRQFALITAGAVTIFLALRLLPTGTNLSHMDFRVDARGSNAIEFCDPLNPQFIPVVAARSPVVMSIATETPALVANEVMVTTTLKTASGKPVAAADLLEVHTRKLHLLIVDPTLTDYQHVHPTATERAGEWSFVFQPRARGTYRVFADFTPAATARGLYASADLEVKAAPHPSETTLKDAAPPRTGEVEREGYRFTLATTPAATRAGQPIDLRFSVSRADGGTVPLEPVMGAYAHLVAFDEARSGFAHLHPAETDLSRPPDAKRPELNFKLTIPKAGRYVVWAQVKLGDRERFAPFGLDVVE